MKKETNKMRNIIGLTSIVLALVGFSACSDNKNAGFQDDQKNYIMYLALNRVSSTSQTICIQAVAKMNQCIGANSGFNPAVMCGPANLQGDTAAPTTAPSDAATKDYDGDGAATAADSLIATGARTSVYKYTALSSCVDKQILATNCNLTQNKVASPVTAKSTVFAICDAGGIEVTGQF